MIRKVTPGRWPDLERLFESGGRLEPPSYRFGGFVPFFTREGFREGGRLGTRRHVMRLDLHR